MVNSKLVIVDFGMGNLRSIQSKLAKLKIESSIANKPAEVLDAGKIILPGVGNFAQGMKNIRERGLRDALQTKVQAEKTPILGICLGMQLLADSSEEGGGDGFGWIKGSVVRFRFSEAERSVYRVPHVGWNRYATLRDNPLFEEIPREKRFYFTHSYHLKCDDRSDILATTDYGHEVVTAVNHENVWGVQFHPEKSHTHGLKLIENFVRRIS